MGVEQETGGSVFSALNTLHVARLGVEPYTPVWQKMRAYTRSRAPSSPDQVWLLQHEPVFTQGQAGRAEHVLCPGEIPIVQTDRGGQVTYHGPGQLVAYVMIDLARRKLGARALVTAIENSIVATLGDYHVEARPRKDAPGVYVGERKIASLGLRVTRGRSFHGLALNIDADLSPFKRINPCGYRGMEMVNLKEFVPDVRLDAVADTWLAHFSAAIGYNELVDMDDPLLADTGNST